MKNGNASDFIDELTYQDHYAIYQGHKYFFNGCQCQHNKSGNITSVSLEIYDITANILLFTTTQNDILKCIKELENAKIFNNKTFWDVEKEMEWVDC